MNLLRTLRTIATFSTQVTRTQIFHTMSNRTLATPELVKRQLLARIPFHSPLSMVSLYHGKRIRHAIKSCFSEKKYYLGSMQDKEVQESQQNQKGVLL